MVKHKVKNIRILIAICKIKKKISSCRLQWIGYVCRGEFFGWKMRTRSQQLDGSRISMD